MTMKSSCSCSPKRPPSTVTVRWQVTAQDINDVFEGTVDIPVKPLDWRAPIQTLLRGDGSAGAGEQAD